MGSESALCSAIVRALVTVKGAGSASQTDHRLIQWSWYERRRFCSAELPVALATASLTASVNRVPCEVALVALVIPHRDSVGDNRD